MFRRLYWVSEAVDPSGKTELLGVYTSIPDLVHYGLRQGDRSLRLSLVKLDSSKAPLGTWEEAQFGSMIGELQPYVVTDEFSSEHVAELKAALSVPA